MVLIPECCILQMILMILSNNDVDDIDDSDSIDQVWRCMISQRKSSDRSALGCPSSAMQLGYVKFWKRIESANGNWWVKNCAQTADRLPQTGHRQKHRWVVPSLDFFRCCLMLRCLPVQRPPFMYNSRSLIIHHLTLNIYTPIFISTLVCLWSPLSRLLTWVGLVT